MATNNIIDIRVSIVSVNQGHDGMSDLEVFLDLVFDFWLGVICGAKPCHGLALFVNHKLGEVPLDGVHQEAPLLVFQKDPKRMGVSSIHIDLAEHIKGDVVLLCGKLLDLFIRARFLSPKLVAGEPKNTQTSSFRVIIVHLYQLPRANDISYLQMTFSTDAWWVKVYLRASVVVLA